MKLHIWSAISPCLALVASAMVQHGSVAQAAGDEGFQTSAEHAILIDMHSNAVLYQKNADELAPPASMSKLMTLAVVFKQLKEGKLKLSDQVTMSVNAWRTGGAPSHTSAMFVPVNSEVSVEELIKGIAVQSGNDAAIAIAEKISGSEQRFAQLMTTEARRLGLRNSTFDNATGLPSPGQLMTARELALLARKLIEEYPDMYPVFSEHRFNYRKHKFINRNPLIFMDLGVDGLKTGYTSESGYGLTFSAVRNGRRLVGVVMGFARKSDRKKEAARLIDWGFKSIHQVRIFDENEIISHARVWGGDQFYVPLSGDGAINMSLPKYPRDQKLSAEVIYNSPLKPPVKAGDQVAIVRITSTSSATVEVPLYATETVNEAGTLRQGLDSLLHLGLNALPF